MLKTEPPEAPAWLSDMVVPALPGGDPHGEVNNPVDALTLERSGWSPGRQAIPNVWEDEGLNQCLDGSFRKHVLQLVDRDEGAETALYDFPSAVLPVEVLV